MIKSVKACELLSRLTFKRKLERLEPAQLPHGPNQNAKKKEKKILPRTDEPLLHRPWKKKSALPRDHCRHGSDGNLVERVRGGSRVNPEETK